MLRTAALAIVSLLAAASLASAQDSPPSPDGPTASCKARAALVLHGRFLAGGTTSFQMDVRRSGRRNLRGTRELVVDARTRFRLDGRPALLATLRSGDRLRVVARMCKRSGASRLELVARSVFARPAL